VDYLSNSFNLLDGMDGLCTGVALIAVGFLAGLAAFIGKPFWVAVSMGLFGALAGFLLYNLPPARIFLGDWGSYLIGGFLAFVVVGILEVVSLKILAILWIFGVPVFDTSAVLLRRVFLKTGMLNGDLKHSYNLLLARFKNIQLVLFGLYGIALFCGACGFGLFFLPPSFQFLSLIPPLFVLFYNLKFSRYFKE